MQCFNRKDCRLSYFYFKFCCKTLSRKKIIKWRNCTLEKRNDSFILEITRLYPVYQKVVYGLNTLRDFLKTIRIYLENVKNTAEEASVT